MESISLGAVALLILSFALVSFPIQRSYLTPPMFFVLFGMLVGPHGLGVIDPDISSSVTKFVVEVTLILVLFCDGTRIQIPGTSRLDLTSFRLLFAGMGIYILLGAVAAYFLFEGLGFWQGALLAAVLAPTDAGLGEASIADERVPLNVRNNINLESGLNDGLAVPVLIFLMVCESLYAGASEAQFWLGFAAREIGGGALAGVAVGLLGEWLLTSAQKNKTIMPSFQQLAGIALALLAYSSADLCGGNGLIAAYLAGFSLGNARQGHHSSLLQFSHHQKELFSLITFMFFGALWVLPALKGATWKTFLFAMLCLTVIRIVSVLLSMLGSSMPMKSKFYIAWVGPKGIASLLFGLIVLENFSVPHREEIFLITTVTVFLSIFLHGLSAKFLVKLYDQKAD
ncbi:MAG: NhaP-type Na+/H+ or K+/H+ antiporter [Chlamydiales bacterium]|jgi:NhaP-type Na+/H+ or K+/H+ antiporter